MRWRGRRQSGNVEDRRGLGGRGIAVGGGGLGLLILLLVVFLCGGDPRQLLEALPSQIDQPPAETRPDRTGRPRDEQEQFVRVVLADTEDVWNAIFRQNGAAYREPRLVLFDDKVASACGYASAAVGPFYCPGDSRVYLDFSFFRELDRRFDAGGDFAQAYVIAHEVGHHVQNLTGAMAKVQRSGNSNEMSVRLELQADCYAGIYANYAKSKGFLEAGDAEEALRAAAAVGDDNIQKETQGYVVPDSFTHGSSRQRIEWFSRGFRSGDIRDCDTFR